MDLFDYQADSDTRHQRPLAERMRPGSLDAFVGQAHVTGPEGILRRAIHQDRPFSLILWGPPGCGKTTLARILAASTKAHFIEFSAVLAGVKDIRDVIAGARQRLSLKQQRTLLFVDEIHRFNKAQQDAFLHHVESGLITLVGATTENPSFEVIPALMSRCRLIVLERLSEEDLQQVMTAALEDVENGLGRWRIFCEPAALRHLAAIADGDARAALNGLELAAQMASGGRRETDGTVSIDLATVEQALQRKALIHDRAGEAHFDLISAYHKSMRGSDPDAALYWLERMLLAGEDALYIARRMVRFASEDVGNADPHALSIAMSAVGAFQLLGHPEGDLALAQATVYLACAPKSNRVYQASRQVREAIDRTGSLPVPLHLRNAPTGMMRSLGYGRGYRYAHDHPDAVVAQDHLPERLAGQRFYDPSPRGYEKSIASRLERWRRRIAARER